MQIVIESPRTPDVLALLEEHLAEMHSVTPPESCHALGDDELDDPAITFWVAREGETLLGIGALKQHRNGTGEIKSMRTVESARGQGVAAVILNVIVGAARKRGLRSLNLETGAEEHFAPARTLYEKHGFRRRGPFGGYTEDPNSVFYTLEVR